MAESTMHTMDERSHRMEQGDFKTADATSTEALESDEKLVHLHLQLAAR